MLKVVTRALLVAMVGMGGLSAVPAVALADGIYFGFDTGPTYHRDRDRFAPPPGVYDRHGPPPGFDRHGPRGECSDREALRRAWRMGLERPEIVRVTPRRVIVEGQVGRRLRQMEFANVPGCPPL